MNLVRKILLVSLVSLTLSNSVSAFSDPLMGTIASFGFNFCPRGWAKADGRLLQISSYSALFSLFGTQYGGDGRTTFGLPDLEGRTIIGYGQGPGLSDYRIGSKGGAETVTLTTNQVPNHTHSVMIKAGRGTTSNGSGLFFGESGIYRTTGNGKTLNTATLSSSGGGREHENRMPYQALNYCVALTGVYPSRS